MWVVRGGFVLVVELVGGGSGLVRLVVSYSSGLGRVEEGFGDCKTRKTWRGVMVDGRDEVKRRRGGFGWEG